MDTTIKENYSWEIINEDIIIKHCDKSVFEYAQTGIPKKLKSFFGNFDERGKEIVLNYNNHQYIATVKVIDKRARLFWKKDLKHQFSIYNNNIENISLKFKKNNNNINLYVLATDYVKNDTESEHFNFLIQEGRKVEITSTIYERSAKLRQQAIKIHGTKCSICGFDYEQKYGLLGKDYIEIHHVQPLYLKDTMQNINPEKDLIPVCANCHRMLHRSKDKIILPDELRNIITNNEVNNEF